MIIDVYVNVINQETRYGNQLAQYSSSPAARQGLGERHGTHAGFAGGTVVIADMQVESEAVAKGKSGAFVRCDVSNEADAQAVVDKAVSLGKLMGLVNCAGIAPLKTVGRTARIPWPCSPKPSR